MKDPLLSEDVFPIGEFKKHASRLFRRLKETGRPIIVTQNGTPAGVLVPADEFDRMRETARFKEAVAEGLCQSESGDVLSSKDVDRELDRAFGVLGNRTT